MNLKLYDFIKCWLINHLRASGDCLGVIVCFWQWTLNMNKFPYLLWIYGLHLTFGSWSWLWTLTIPLHLIEICNHQNIIFVISIHALTRVWCAGVPKHLTNVQTFPWLSWNKYPSVTRLNDIRASLNWMPSVQWIAHVLISCTDYLSRVIDYGT